MSGSTETQIIEVEGLLRNFGTTPPTMDADDALMPASRGFNSRPVVAACLALLVFAPGCAAAAVFLMRADGTVPPIITPDSNPPFVTKSDRLPLQQWSNEAIESLGAKDAERMVAAAATADPVFLSPILIRGSLEDGTLTTLAEPAVAQDPIAASPRPRLKRDVRRNRPKLVAELTPPPETPQPSFFEKLFGPRLR